MPGISPHCCTRFPPGKSESPGISLPERRAALQGGPSSRPQVSAVASLTLMANAGVLRRVVVGVDGSPGSCDALDWAVGLAGRFDAEVVVVHGRGLLEEAHHAPDVPGWLAAVLAAVPAEVPLSLRIIDGPPADALLRGASACEADLIVVGRRGAGSPFEVTLGSTSREVSSQAAVPVLVVPGG